MVKSEVLELWEHTLKTLEKKLNKYTYETWLKSIKPLGCYDNTIIIEVPNHFTRGWLSDRFAPLLKTTFKNILNQDMGVQFILSNEVHDQEIDTTIKTGLNNFNKPAENSGLNNFEETPYIRLNPKYTFDTFVVGNSNRFSHAACQAVAEAPSKAYNPLFIYGGVGLGKTHLLHAIGQFILRHNNKLNICYVTSEKFTNDMIASIRDYKTFNFKNKYRSMDILLVDDIQFLAGKERTQEEFFHTFNTLYEANKQIVISSDRQPREILTLEERLRSRFEWGLITDIQPPDLETRIAILSKKANQENLMVPDETIIYIANKIRSNIRELEGALIRVIAFASLNNREINADMAAEVLKDILPPNKPKQITFDIIQKIVASFYNISIDDFKAKKRSRNISFPRQIAMYLCRELTDMSLPQIGAVFGGRDHTTVLHACNKINKELLENTVFQDLIRDLMDRIKNSNLLVD